MIERQSSTPFFRTLQCTHPAHDAPWEVVVTIHLPEKDPLPGGDYRVLLQIAGAGEPYSHYVHGADALHAFLECCWLVSEILPSLVPAGSQLTWEGREDLGFWKRSEDR